MKEMINQHSVISGWNFTPQHLWKIAGNGALAKQH